MTTLHKWTTKGFDEFRRGSFGNAGQNIYVSKAGVLQRIYQFDLNKNGYLDLIFCNDHDHHESAPTYVYSDPIATATRYEVPSDGSRSGTMADLNGDGYDDLVLGMYSNGTAPELNAFVYYGGPDGFSERRRQLLPVPFCISTAAGDFDGDGKLDLAFVRQPSHDSVINEIDMSARRLRIFPQTDLGFEPERFVEMDIDADHIWADDLDGDGFDDLVIRSITGEVFVIWGSPGGLSLGNKVSVPVETGGKEWSLDPHYEEEPEEARGDARPIPKVVRIGNVPHIFVPRERSFALVPVSEDRTFGTPQEFECERPMSVAVGDINGDGYQDVAVASRDYSTESGESSWVYWGSPDGYIQSNRTRLPSLRACDIDVADLDGDGYDDIVLCQNRTLPDYTTESVIYRGGRDGVTAEETRLTTEDARRVFSSTKPNNDSRELVFVNQYSRHANQAVPSYVYFGDADGYSPERRQELLANHPVGSITPDLNDDGYPEVVFVNTSLNTLSHDSGCWVYLNGPDGLPDKASIVLPSTRAHGLVCGDIDRDGYLDVIIGGYMNPELLIYHGTAEGFDVDNPKRIRMKIDGVDYDDVRFMCLIDFNNDGWLDLVVPQVSSDRSFILWGGPDGFSMDRKQMLSVRHAGGAQGADLTGNGYPDLIIGGGAASLRGPHSSHVYIYWNGPEGLREDRRTLLPANGAGTFGIADFNHTGTLDLMMACYHGPGVRDIDSYIYWNRPGKGFSDGDRYRFFTHSAIGTTIADFNEDGWVDMAVGYHKIDGDHVGNSAVFWNGSDGFDERNITELPTLGPHGMVFVSPGNILDRGPEEHFTSPPHELPPDGQVTSITWEGTVPQKTWVRAQLRFAETEAGLEAAPWMGPKGGDSWYDNGQDVPPHSSGEHWVQYKLALGAFNGLSTPRITQVDVHY